MINRIKATGKSIITAKDIAYYVDFLIDTVHENGPFKKRRLAIKRQKREREEKRGNGQSKAERPKQPEFDLEQQTSAVKEMLQRTLAKWPAEHRDTLVKMLREYAKRAVLSAVTCPACGSHEADDDGDCISCHAPGIVGKSPARKKRKVTEATCV